jgi:hypothetical protein
MSKVTEVKLPTFVKLLIATIKGDDAEVTAIKIQKKAKMFLKAQIAVKEAHTLALEAEVEEAIERLVKVRTNGGDLITDGENYVCSLLAYNRTVIEKEGTLEKHLKNITFLEEQLALVTK